MPLATASQVLQDYSLELALPSLNATFGTPSRTVTRRTITITSDADVGASSINIKANAAAGVSTVIKAGTALSFSFDTPFQSPVLAKIRQQAIVLNDITLTGSTTLSNVAVGPLTRPIKANSIADFIVGLTPLCGIQTMDMANQETMVDTTHFGSGSSTEMALVRAAKSFSISGVALAGDEALESIVKPLGAFSGQLFGREAFAVATMPDGERFEGFAKITALNFPANQNEVKKYSFTLTYQGRTFAWYTPYDFSQPFITAVTPAVNSTGFAVGSNLTATFNQNISLGSGTVTLVRASDNAVVNTSISVSTNTLTINPTVDLAASTTYYVQIQPNAISSFAGIDDSSWTFTTAA